MKNLKRIICVAITFALLLSLCVSSFALPINVGITDSYFYNENAIPIAAPIAYRPVTVKGSDTFGTTFDPVDLTVGEDYIYIVDRESHSTPITPRRSEFPPSKIRKIIRFPI